MIPATVIMDPCTLKVYRLQNSRGKYFYKPHGTVVVLFPGGRDTFPTITLPFYSWGQLNLVTILDKNCDGELVFCDGDSWSSYSGCAQTIKATTANRGREGEGTAICKTHAGGARS